MKIKGISVALIMVSALVSCSQGQEDGGFADELKLKDYQPEGKLKSYLFTSARNRVLNFFRDNNKICSLDDTDEDGNAYFHDELAGDDPQPLDKLEQAELAERIRQATLRLPPAQREVVYLKQYMTFREAAELLSRPLGTVLADHYRAVRKMQNFLKEEA